MQPRPEPNYPACNLWGPKWLSRWWGNVEKPSNMQISELLSHMLLCSARNYNSFGIAQPIILIRIIIIYIVNVTCRGHLWPCLSLRSPTAMLLKRHWGAWLQAMIYQGSLRTWEPFAILCAVPKCSLSGVLWVSIIWICQNISDARLNQICSADIVLTGRPWARPCLEPGAASSMAEDNACKILISGMMECKAYLLANLSSVLQLKALREHVAYR